MEVKDLCYKFVSWDVDPLETLKDSKIYKAIESAIAGDMKPLKAMYSDRFCFGHDSLLQGYYKLQGWKFFLEPFCRTFLVKRKYDNVFYEYLAPNKTCLYNLLGGRHNVSKVYEVKEVEGAI